MSELLCKRTMTLERATTVSETVDLATPWMTHEAAEIRLALWRFKAERDPSEANLRHQIKLEIAESRFPHRTKPNRVAQSWA